MCVQNAFRADFVQSEYILNLSDLQVLNRVLEKVQNKFCVSIRHHREDPLFNVPWISCHGSPALSIFCSCQHFFWYDDTQFVGGSEVPLDDSNVIERLFDYPHGFERLYSALKNAVPPSSKSIRSKLTASVFQKLKQLRKDLIPAHNAIFKAQLEKDVVTNNDPKDDPLAIFCNWFATHQCYKKCTPKRCGGLRVLKQFIDHEEGSFQDFVNFLKLQFMLHNKKAFHFSAQKPYSDRAHERNMYMYVQEANATAKFMTLENTDLHGINDQFVQVPFKCFCASPNFTHSACIFEEFEGNSWKTMLDLANADRPMSLENFVLMQKNSSLVTSRWLRHESGHTLNLWAHMPKYEHKKCEVEKCTNIGEKWRHMIFSYAVMALLWNEYNGNKEGPIGDYPFRSAQEIGKVTAKDDKTYGKECRVYASKMGGMPDDYVGHNIVALAVGKRGDILRIAYNHNTLFSSTVDHAEERLIDGLYKDPEAFVQKSHARIYGAKEKLAIENHMRHISVYTSLEPCQQCSGKFHLALVPEVISCQRDWEIKLLGGQLYEQFHKSRAILGSYFDFSPYEELGMTYINFCQRVARDKDIFFKLNDRKVDCKATMPYFLCTDEAQSIFRRGHDVFDKIFRILYHTHQNDRPVVHFDDDQSDVAGLNFFSRRDPLGYFEDDVCRTVTETDKRDLLQKFNLDVSQWLGTIDDSFFMFGNSDDSCAQRIRCFRPSLSDKQKRISHDELLHYRRRWTSLLFKLMCSVTFEFDSNCHIDEHDIETHISPLGDISSIELSRDARCSLTGSFTVIFSSSESADEVKNTFNKIYVSDSGGPFFKAGVIIASAKRKPFIEASSWLYSIRRPQSHEIFIPVEWVKPPPQVAAQSQKKAYLVIPEKERANSDEWAIFQNCKLMETEMNKRNWPLLESQSIAVLKCPDSAFARRLKTKLPNFDAPKTCHILILPETKSKGGSNGSVVVRYEKGGDFDGLSHVKKPDPSLVTVSLLARVDVTEADILHRLKRIISGRFPKHLCVSFVKLSTCKSQETLKWLYIGTDVKDKPQTYDWRLWRVQCMAADSELNFVDNIMMHLPYHQFCQPYPHIVFEYLINFNNIDWEVGWDPSHPSAVDQSSQHDLQFLLNVKGKSKTYEYLVSCSKNSGRTLAHVQKIAQSDDELLRINFVENSFATLICSNVLVDFTTEFKLLITYLITKAKGKPYMNKGTITESNDFWGAKLEVVQPHNYDEAMVSLFLERFVDAFLIIRKNNVFDFCLKSLDSSLKYRRNFLFSSPSVSRKACKYCSVFFDVPAFESRSIIGPLNLQCAKHSAHRISDKPADELQCVGKYLTKRKVGDLLNGHENISLEPNGTAAQDTNIKWVLDRIKTLESNLQLELCVENKMLLIREASNSTVLAIGSCSLMLRRDEYHMPAHLTCFFGFPFFLEKDKYNIKFGVSIPHDEQVVTNGRVFPSVAVEIVREEESKKGQSFLKLFGRLEKRHPDQEEKSIESFSEGGQIPARDLRVFLEPEYFPELFQLDSQHPLPFYPTMNLSCRSACIKAKDSGQKQAQNSVEQQQADFDIAIHSWDFAEFQCEEIKSFLMSRKQLRIHEFYVNMYQQQLEELDKELKRCALVIPSHGRSCIFVWKEAPKESIKFRTYILYDTRNLESNPSPWSILEIPCGFAKEITSIGDKHTLIKLAFEQSVYDYCYRGDDQTNHKNNDDERERLLACVITNFKGLFGPFFPSGSDKSIEKAMSSFLVKLRLKHKQKDERYHNGTTFEANEEFWSSLLSEFQNLRTRHESYNIILNLTHSKGTLDGQVCHYLPFEKIQKAFANSSVESDAFIQSLKQLPSKPTAEHHQSFDWLSDSTYFKQFILLVENGVRMQFSDINRDAKILEHPQTKNLKTWLTSRIRLEAKVKDFEKLPGLIKIEEGLTKCLELLSGKMRLDNSMALLECFKFFLQRTNAEEGGKRQLFDEVRVFVFWNFISCETTQMIFR